MASSARSAAGCTTASITPRSRYQSSGPCVGLGDNGLGDDGLGDNGLGDNALGENGLGDNELGDNGLGSPLPGGRGSPTHRGSTSAHPSRAWELRARCYPEP